MNTLSLDDYNEALHGIGKSTISKVAYLGFLEGRDQKEILEDICDFSRSRKLKISLEEIRDTVQRARANQRPPEPGPLDDHWPDYTEAKQAVVVKELDAHDARLAELRKRLTENLKEDEINEILREIRQIKLLQNTVNVSEWLLQEPAEPDQILLDTADVGDKLTIIASSKMHKTFFLLQLLLSLAAGRDFLQWKVPKPRRVVLINLEIQAHHYHKRSINVTQAEGITPQELGDRFHVVNCRGLGVEGPEGVSMIEHALESLHPEIIAFDPLYKIASGTENDIESGKIILNAFDGLIQSTGAAIAFVHHDAKGSPGDRDIRDRGAGSNVLSRDYDACFTLTPHVTDRSAVVVETILRNYRPQDPFTAVWVEDDPVMGCYHFEERLDIVPEKKTSKTRTPTTALPAYLPAAISILGDNEMEMGPFKTSFKEKTGLSDNRIRDFMNWAISGGKPSLSTREERGRGMYRKLIKFSGDVGYGR